MVSKRQVRQIIMNCDACQSIDPAPVKWRRGCLSVERVWQRLAIDITHCGGRAYLTLIDSGLSRFAIWRPLKHQSSANVVDQLESVFFERGAPEEILADNDTTFRSQVFEQLTAKWDVRVRFRSAHYPAGNSIVERCHRTVKVIVARKGCSVAETVHLYNITPRDDCNAASAPANVLYSYQTKPPGARCNTQYHRGTVTGTISYKVVEVDGMPLHVRDLRRRAATEERSHASSVRSGSDDETFVVIPAIGRVQEVPSYFRTFGIKGFVLNKRSEKGKFDPRGIPCTFVGHSEVSKGFRVVLNGERRVSVTRDLKCVDNFGETETVGEFLTAETLADGTHHDNPPDEDRLQGSIDIPVTMNGQMRVGLPAAPVTVPDEEAKRDLLVQCRGRPRSICTGKRGRPRKQYHFSETSAECLIDETKEEPVERKKENETVELNVEAAAIAEIPVAEAMESPDAREWYDAIKMEILSLVENNSWFIVERPSDRQIVGSRLVLCNKFKSDGNLKHRKARLVAQDYTQQRGTDFKETFAPVVRLNSIRTLMALAVEKGLTVHQLDIATAFLNGDLEEEIFMQPSDLLEKVLEEIVQ
uniref:Integrase catalytic domain-containing protein n=1 Tax=Trichuris muris TaxID=70415 RepID=A0A5S6QBI6_TRIMR